MANILEDVQNYVVGKLSGDYILSACPFLAENRKDIDYEIKNRLGKQGIVGLVMTPKATYAGKFEDLFLSWTLEELEIYIVENVTVNRDKRNGFVTGQDAAMRLFDVLCPLSGDFEGQFNPVSYEEGEDGNLIVNKCVLKALIYGEHGDVPQPEKPITYQFVKLLDQPPPLSVQPHDGWMWQDADGLYFYVDHVVHKLGDVSSEQLSAYVESQVSSKVEISAFNELQNSLSDYYTKSQTSSNVELNTAFETVQSAIDDIGNSLSDYYTKSETSSASEISIALGSKQDNLTPLQLLALSAEIDENKTILVGGYSNGYYFPVYVDWYGEVTQEMVSAAINQISETLRFSIGVRLGTAVSAIGVSAFANTKVTEVYAPQNVVQVKDYAFANSDLLRIKFDYSKGRYTPIVIGDYAFQSCSSLVLADIPADHSINIGVSAFDGCPFTARNESLYPYYYGLYFNRTDSHTPEVIPGQLTTLPNYPWGLSSASAIKFGTTASRYWVECQHYEKDTLFTNGGITITGTRPNNRAYWLYVGDTTFTTFTLPASATTQVRIIPANRTTGKMYNAYLALSAAEGITRPFVWYTLSGSYTFDKFQDEYIQNNPLESGKINYYHIYEYQPDHFAVEKLGWTEEQLSAKADISALNAVESSLSNYALTSQIPLSVSQLENDAGYLTEHQSLSDYYTKSETSSNAEISTALNLKQDKLTDEQMANVNTKCLPLNLSGNTEISGNQYLDFRCLARFFSPVVMNGALDVKQLNIVNYEVDSYTSLSAIDEDTIEFVGGFNREHAAVLNLKNDTIAYISDVDAMISSKADLSALEEVENSLSDYYTKSETSSNTEISVALALKQDKLSDAQISSINNAVDERKTYFTFPNNEVQSVYVEGLLDTNYLQQLNPELSHQKILTATEVKIGTAVTGINDGAFNGCSNLVKVTIPDSVVTIGEMAFAACYALVSLEIPDGVSTINNLFNYTDVHADIVFGKGVQSISQGMFHYVSPASVTFKGKTMAEVQAMTDYPWDIEDTSIIKTYNIATQEWVLQQLSALSAMLQNQ